jgi:copper resistance protein D
LKTLPLKRSEKTFWITLSLLLFVVCVVFLSAPAWTRHPNLGPESAMSNMDMSNMADMAGMDHGTAIEETPAEKAKHLADKRESEFNHHLAGVLVILAALFFLAQPMLTKRWPAARYAWPICFLIAGIFLFIFSDTEIWPFGNQSFIYAMTHNPEDVQHKTFALILLVLGVIEMLRASGRLKAAWSAWVFPVVSLGGCILLLFHHHGGMHGPDAMKTMVSVQHQHLHFAEAGAGAAVTKGLAESGAKWYEIFSKIWPLFLIVLGVMLVMYTE